MDGGRMARTERADARATRMSSPHLRRGCVTRSRIGSLADVEGRLNKLLDCLQLEGK